MFHEKVTCDLLLKMPVCFKPTVLVYGAYHACMRMAFLLTMIFLTGCGSSNDTPDLAWGKRGIRAGDFVRPRAITIGEDAAGNEAVYVVDYAGRVQVFTPEGKPLGLWSTPTISNGRPAGLCWSKVKKQLIVADSHYQQILLYQPDGTLVKAIPGTVGVGNLGPFQYVADIAEDEAGNWFVSEFGNENEDRIRKLNPSGRTHHQLWQPRLGVWRDEPASRAVDLQQRTLRG
jgi:hypothetical protein